MRGNETKPIWPLVSTRSMFPIPMRGNECWEQREKTIRVLKFPIPMRGNEHGKDVESYFGAIVSNPHEG